MSFAFGGGAGGGGGFGAAPAGGAGAFGAPSAFGAANKPATPGFGGFGGGATTGGGFGAAPAATGGAGLFGGGATGGATAFGGGAASPTTGFGAAAAPTGGFGAGGFGAGATTSAFGAKPATAGAASSPFGQSSLFGGASTQSTFGAPSTGGFGTTASTGGGFGTPAPAASSGGLFGGAGGGAFGAKPAAAGPFGGGATAGTSAFGSGGAATTGAFGAATGAFGAAAPAQPQVGTGNPPYQPHRDTDAGGPVHYLSISRMQAYSHKSAEELRFEDYLKRTNPAAAAQQAAMYPATAAAPAGAGATGAAGGFGGFGAGATTGGFGAAGTTGTQGAFGTTTGAFGATPAASTGGFGGGFTTGGASTPGAGGGLFGSTTRSAGGFGAVSQPMGASAFGGGGGFGATTTGFGGAAATPAPAFGTTGGFGAAQPQQQQTGGFGGFGTGATTGGFGATATTGGFGKPAAASGGFGFGGATTTATPAAGGFGGFGTGAQSGAAGGTSLFGGGGAAAGGSSFGFGTAAKPPASGGFGGFGATAPGTATTTTGGFGTGGGFGATPAAPATGGLFGGGATTGQTGGGLFGGGATTAAPATSTGGFGFGGGTTLGSAAPATAGGGLFGGAAGGFGAAKPAGTSLFGGASGASTGTTSLFGSMGSTGTASTGTSGSLFGNAGTATKSLGFGTGGFGFGGGATGSTGFGATTTTAPKTTGFGGFGSFGSATSAAPSTGFSFGGGAATSFTPSALGAAAPATAAPGAAPANASLVAAPDVNPYGTGSFGAGLVEQNVKAALDLPSLKASSSASAARLSSFAQDVGLPRGAMESSVTTRRHLLSNRYSIPVSFIRGSSFKGTKNRLASITSSKSNATQLGSSAGVRFGASAGNAAADDEFKFSSTLFRNSVAKRLVIDKGDGAQATSSASARARAMPPRAAVVPLSEDDAVRDSGAGAASGSQRALLKPEDEDGLYRVVFRNMATNKSFTLRLKGNERVQDAREEVKRLLHATSDKDDSGKGTRDVELLVHGRIVADTLTIDALRLRDGDSIDVALVEDLTGADASIKSKDASAQSSSSASASVSAPAGRFVSYAEFMSSAMRETEAEAASAHAKPVSAACPSLKNEDYFTVPSYDRLKRMTEQELSQVEGFKVGCKGLGTVEWLGKTDVRHLDLDELIQFEKKEVIVYKDDDNKHPLGTGLNRPAIVELLGVFPPRKTQDPEQYRERVQQRTVDIGATFIDYSPSKGIWRFRVEHFSRYGFDDDEEDEDDVDMETTKNNDLQLQHAKAAAAMTTQKKKMAMPPSSAKLPKRVAADDPRVGLLRNSLMYGDRSGGHSSSVASFREDGSALPLMANGGHQEDDDDMTDASVKDVAEEQEDEDETSEPIVEMQKSVVFPMANASVAILPLGIDSETSRLPRDATSTTYQIYLQATQQQQRQLTPTTTPTAKSHVDMGLFMARSFRCSWGPNGELVNIGKLVTGRPRDHSQQLGRRVAIEMPLEVAGAQRKALTTELLDMHFKCCEASPFEGDCTDAAPLYALPSTNEGVVHCLHEYVAFAERVRQQFPSSRRFRRWSLLWKLVHALWGQEHDQLAGGASQRACPLAARDDPREIESMESLPMVDLRREAISRWFEDALSAEWANATAVDADEPSQARVLQLLCQHRIVEAAEAAMECGDLRLSTMIAQTATYEGSDFRTLIADQLAQWTENGTLEFMEEDVVMVYSLLAGSVEVVTAQRAKDLTWLMCLALFFWYKRGPAVSLKVALRLYREAVDKQLASAPVATIKASTTPHKLDMLMEVMKLYVDDAVSLCSVLSPSGLKGDDWRDDGDRPDLHLDYELSWHLHSVLRAVGYKIDRKWESHVHQNFVRQLDGAGQWKEAVYVALNISDATERAASCRELLVRNTDLLAATPDARRVLAKRYLVPQPWIEEALAVGAVNQHEYRQEIAHWIAAQRFEEAHACLVRHVAPSCLFSGERSVLLQLLEELELFADQISQWSAARIDASGLVGGGLWLEYLRLEQQHGLQMGREAEFLARLLHLAERLTSSSSASSSSATAALTTTERERLVARTALSSMLVTLSTQAIKMRSLLDAEPVEQEELPAQLEPSFLSSLAQLSRGRETKFVETYRAQHVHALCSAFVDWRA